MATLEEIEQAIGRVTDDDRNYLVYGLDADSVQLLLSAAPFLLAEARAAAKMREAIAVVRVGLRTTVDIVLDASWSPDDIADVLGDYADELSKADTSEGGAR